MGAKVDSQVAAPAETRTPNWHRAKIRSSRRVRMEGWRQSDRFDAWRLNVQKGKNQLDSDRPSHGRDLGDSVASPVGSEQCMRNRLRGRKRSSSGGKNEPLGTCDLAGACSGGKFVVSRAGEAYDARARGPNRKFRSRRYKGTWNQTGEANFRRAQTQVRRRRWRALG